MGAFSISVPILPRNRKNGWREIEKGASISRATARETHENTFVYGHQVWYQLLDTTWLVLRKLKPVLSVSKDSGYLPSMYFSIIFPIAENEVQFHCHEQRFSPSCYTFRKSRRCIKMTP